MADDELHTLATQLGAALKARGLVLSMAESCTGGMVAQAVTSVAGSSAWFDRGFVTYSNPSKQEMLGVSDQTLTQFGAVSEQTAFEMAAGALKNSHAQIAGSITGIAGPDGGTSEKPVGMVCFAWAVLAKAISTTTQHFHGNREQIRQQATMFMMTMLIERLNEFK
ncbi:MAG: damage-inducible protein CinA [Methylotenera sp. RIFCSPLOWO2_02_FULL_45_14]|nr:MAG: damage-inducible protein CinA [Methylotenera sp. RIFCSPLOWO2_02_FULL_45_14]